MPPSRRHLLIGGALAVAIALTVTAGIWALRRPGEPPPSPAPTTPLAPATIDPVVVVDAAPPVVPADTWWSLGPIVRPPVPTLPDPSAVGGIRNPVDAFVAARLLAAGLRPAPEADRATLVRRLTFDLHGLPPTPDEVADFLADAGPAAYERLVDRLLASPRYGERLARHWLDVAHYADTHGFDRDKRRRHAWPYRDYVVRAFNRDLPYDRFVREQVAGDVLVPASADGVVATGFLAAGPWDYDGQLGNQEGSLEREKARVLDRDDMVAATFTAFLGLTVHCARCHDHKSDPIRRREYYGLAAVFAGVDRGDRAYSNPEVATRRMALEARRDALMGLPSDALRRITVAADPEWLALERALADEVAQRDHAPPVAPAARLSVPPLRIAAERSVALTIDLGEAAAVDTVRLVPARGARLPRHVRVEFGAASIDVVVDDLPDRRGHALPIALGGAVGRTLRIRVTTAPGSEAAALDELEVEAGGRNIALGRAVIVTVAEPNAGAHVGFRSASLTDGRDSLGPREADRRSAEDRIHALWVRRSAVAARLLPAEVSAGLLRLHADRAAVEAAIADLPACGIVYTVVPRPPRPVHVLARGEVDRPGDEALPTAPAAVIGPVADFRAAATGPEGLRRAALAEWLVHRHNGLLRRCLVNRIWGRVFGRAIVDTPNDLGRSGSPPSHPELLEWLAAEFQAGGGSVKGLVRLLVCSAAYRRSSAHDPAAALVDTDNRLLWRFPRRRLEAEEVRDALRAIAGDLSPAMGGPGFENYAYTEQPSPIYDYARGAADDDRRRAIYRFVVRNTADPLLAGLDCPDANVSVPVRSEAVSAPQALSLLNNPFVLRQAERFAARLETLAPDTPGRVAAMVGIPLGRPPTDEERTALAGYAERHGLAAACRVVVNSSAFLYVD